MRSGPVWLEKICWRPHGDQQERAPQMCNLTWLFSVKVTAAPNQSKLNRIRKDSVKEDLLEKRLLEQVHKNLLERKESGIFQREWEKQ